MTFSAYGYIKTALPLAEVSEFSLLERRNGPRLREEDVRDLHNFPPDLLPEDGFISCFSIAESPTRNGVEYLLDSRDYAPESDIGLPVQASERRTLLVDLVAAILCLPGLLRLAVALTDSDEIERIKFVGPLEIADKILSDCSDYSPPNVLYICDPSAASDAHPGLTP